MIEKYGESDGRALANPVGTGPYRLAKWVRSSKILLEANPHYRGFTWNFASADPADAARLWAWSAELTGVDAFG